MILDSKLTKVLRLTHETPSILKNAWSQQDKVVSGRSRAHFTKPCVTCCTTPARCLQQVSNVQPRNKGSAGAMSQPGTSHKTLDNEKKRTAYKIHWNPHGHGSSQEKMQKQRQNQLKSPMMCQGLTAKQTTMQKQRQTTKNPNGCIKAKQTNLCS